jgi:hypothetical protein
MTSAASEHPETGRRPVRRLKFFLRLAAIVLLSTLVLSLPAYLLYKHELAYRGMDRILPGVLAMTLMPAIRFPLFLFLLLLPTWWLGRRLKPWHGAMYGVLAVILYALVISVLITNADYGAFANMEFVRYFVMRLTVAIPAMAAAALVVGLATWFVSKLSPQA